MKRVFIEIHGIVLVVGVLVVNSGENNGFTCDGYGDLWGGELMGGFI